MVNIISFLPTSRHKEVIGNTHKSILPLESLKILNTAKEDKKE
uniref:Uncharacterized protein n=1 Tax=Arundo donax TaxID=35708 RepID=A0A0A8XZW7_ARUDO